MMSGFGMFHDFDFVFLQKYMFTASGEKIREEVFKVSVGNPYQKVSLFPIGQIVDEHQQ